MIWEHFSPLFRAKLWLQGLNWAWEPLSEATKLAKYRKQFNVHYYKIEGMYMFRKLSVFSPAVQWVLPLKPAFYRKAVYPISRTPTTTWNSSFPTTRRLAQSDFQKATQITYPPPINRKIYHSQHPSFTIDPALHRRHRLSIELWRECMPKSPPIITDQALHHRHKASTSCLSISNDGGLENPWLPIVNVDQISVAPINIQHKSKE